MATLDDVARLAAGCPMTKKDLREAVVDAWLACAPPRLADEYLRRGA